MAGVRGDTFVRTLRRTRRGNGEEIESLESSEVLFGSVPISGHRQGLPAACISRAPPVQLVVCLSGAPTPGRWTWVGGVDGCVRNSGRRRVHCPAVRESPYLQWYKG